MSKNRTQKNYLEQSETGPRQRKEAGRWVQLTNTLLKSIRVHLVPGSKMNIIDKKIFWLILQFFEARVRSGVRGRSQKKKGSDFSGHNAIMLSPMNLIYGDCS